MSLVYSIADLDSPRHDAPDADAAGVLSKIVICSSPRTGSYLLCEAMRQVGLGVPHEYFNPPTVETLSRRWGVPAPVRATGWLPWPRGAKDAAAFEAYRAALQDRRTRNGVFAVKLQHWQYAQYLRHPAGADFLDAAHFLYLYRTDLLDQAISLRFAKLTGRWGADGAVTSRAQPAPNFFNLGAIDREVRVILGEEAGWRRFFAARHTVPRSLSYENLCRRPLDVARRIAGSLFPDRTLIESAPISGPDAQDDARLGKLKSDVRAAYLKREGRPTRGLAWPEDVGLLS